MGIISAVKQLWNKFKPDTLREDSNYGNFRPIFFKANKPTKVVFQKLVKEKATPKGAVTLWNVSCNVSRNVLASTLWREKLHETFRSVKYPATWRPKLLRDKLQEPLPKVELSSTFRTTFLATILAIAGYITMKFFMQLVPPQCH